MVLWLLTCYRVEPVEPGWRVAGSGRMTVASLAWLPGPAQWPCGLSRRGEPLGRGTSGEANLSPGSRIPRKEHRRRSGGGHTGSSDPAPGAEEWHSPCFLLSPPVPPASPDCRAGLLDAACHREREQRIRGRLMHTRACTHTACTPCVRLMLSTALGSRSVAVARPACPRQSRAVC